MMKKLSAIFMAALMVALSVSIVGAATVDTEDVGSNGWKLDTPSGIKAVNEGPVGRRITWNPVKGVSYYRVYYKNSKGNWVGMGNTTQTVFYDTHPTQSGDTYTVRCIDEDWNFESYYDTKGYTITEKTKDSDHWVVGKHIKVAGAEAGYRGNASAKAGFYSNRAGSNKICDIPNGTKLTVLAVEYNGGKTDCFNTRFKTQYNGKTGYVKMNYAMVSVNEFLPSANVALSFASNRPYTWHKANGGIDGGLYNMFNYKGSANYIKGITDQKFYTENTAWLRYDVLKQLTNCQIDFIREGKYIKIYDAFRPHWVTGKIDPAWDRYIKANGLKEKSAGGYPLTNQIASAQYVSKHNTGCAVDISLVDINGVELYMPTLMHDLSWNAEYAKWKNGTSAGAKNAQYLRKNMTSRGFGTYFGEWWHFEYNKMGENAKVVYDCGV